MKKGILNIGFSPREVGYSGETLLVGKVERYSTIAYSDIVAYAAKAAAVPESAITMAMEALYDAMSYFVLNGHSVQIPNIGTFYLTVKCKAANSLADFSTNFDENLRGLNIRFRPCVELKQQIAGTALKTGVGDLTGYTSQAQIGVKSVNGSYGAFVSTLQAGDLVPLTGLTQIVIGGTRLSDAFIGHSPVVMVYLDAQLAAHTVKLDDSAFTQRYESIAISGQKLRQLYTDARYVKELRVMTEGGAQVFGREFMTPAAEGLTVGMVFFNGRRVAAGGTVNATLGQQALYRVYGNGTDLVAGVKVGGNDVDITAIGQNYIEFGYTPAATGNAPVTFYDEDETLIGTFNMSIGDVAQAVPTIAAITANGDPLVNGGTTNITAGASYNLTIAGANLDLLSVSDFHLPGGTSIVFTSQSATMIAATITNTQAGTLAVISDGTTLFSGTLTAVTSSISVTGYKETVNGTTHALNIQNEFATAGSHDLWLVGQNIDQLTLASFSSSNSSHMTVTAYDAATGKVTVNILSAIGSNAVNLIVTANATTIATLSLSLASGGGGIDQN